VHATRWRADIAPAIALSIAGLTLVLSATGCARDPTPSPERRAVVDGLGRTVSVPVRPRRVVSLAPSVTETLLALDVGDRLVGVSDHCVLPDAMTAPRRVGGLVNPDLETIRALRPDLLIGTTSGNDPALAAQIEALALPLYIIHTPDVERVIDAVLSVGALIGEPERGTRVAAEMRQRLAAVAARVAGLPSPRVLFVIWAEPLVVPGRGAFLTDAILRAGGASVTADVAAPHPTFSVESAVARAPEVILTTADNATFAAALPRDPAWLAAPAVRLGRIHVIGDAVVRPGPGVVGGIEEMAAVLHPIPGEAPPGAPKR
jgi:cobalamin transport system substrate-binding protein